MLVCLCGPDFQFYPAGHRLASYRQRGSMEHSQYMLGVCICLCLSESQLSGLPQSPVCISLWSESIHWSAMHWSMSIHCQTGGLVAVANGNAECMFAWLSQSWNLCGLSVCSTSMALDKTGGQWIVMSLVGARQCRAVAQVSCYGLPAVVCLSQGPCMCGWFCSIKLHPRMWLVVDQMQVLSHQAGLILVHGGLGSVANYYTGLILLSSYCA